MSILFSLAIVAGSTAALPQQCLETTHHADGSVSQRWVERPGEGVGASASSSSGHRSSASSSVSVSSGSHGRSQSSASSHSDGHGRSVRVEQDSDGCRITIDERSPTGE